MEKFKGIDIEDFSLRSLSIIDVLEGKGVHGALTEVEPIGADSDTQGLRVEKAQIACASIVTALGENRCELCRTQ